MGDSTYVLFLFDTLATTVELPNSEIYFRNFCFRKSFQATPAQFPHERWKSIRTSTKTHDTRNRMPTSWLWKIVAKVFNILNERLYLFIGLLEKTYRTKHHINLPLLISSRPVCEHKDYYYYIDDSLFYRCPRTPLPEHTSKTHMSLALISQGVRKNHEPHAQYACVGAWRNTITYGFIDISR